MIRALGALSMVLAWICGSIAGLLSTATTILLVTWVVLLIAPNLLAVSAATVAGYLLTAFSWMILGWLTTGMFAIGGAVAVAS